MEVNMIKVKINNLREKIKDIILLDPDIHRVPDDHIMDMIMEEIEKVLKENA